MPYFLRILDDGRAEVCESKSPTLDVPSHLGKVWLDGDIICLQFPAIEEIKVAGRSPLELVGHLVRLPADETGIAAAEGVLRLRQKMMDKGGDALLLAFAERGTDRSEILRLYGEHLGGGMPQADASSPVGPAAQSHGFRANEFVVYPAHGVGQILAIEEQEIAGAKLALFVINFVKDKMTLRVPTAKIANVGMRKLSDPTTINRAQLVLGSKPHVPEGDWSRIAQEYDAKINSGDIIALAEVARDLYQPAINPGQSYAERQLYDAAVDRLAREISVVHRITEAEAVRDIESILIARPRQWSAT
jgi:RNA polymerase-interacting CarD/CdnL/TRCF family regulator